VKGVEPCIINRRAWGWIALMCAGHVTAIKMASMGLISAVSR
jgi:hypothetical protein